MMDEASLAAERAATAGFPAFIMPVQHSTAFNATPYVMSFKGFCSTLAALPNRSQPLSALHYVLAEARRLAVEVSLILVGGSVLDPANAHPRDIDCVLLYHAAQPCVAVRADCLVDLQFRGKQIGADVRFIPLDSDPLILVKAVSFFTTLFGESKPIDGVTQCRHLRGLLLVDCRR